MDFLKAQLARLQHQFGQLTASQKMLSVALVAIMVMTLAWWGKYAGQSEFEPVIEQDFAAEDLARITADLRGRLIPFTTQGARILVPADRKYEVLGSLIYQQLLPKDMSSAFNDIFLKNDNVLGSEGRSERLLNEARQAMLAQIIKSFPRVRNAMVMIDNGRKRSFGDSVGASASVFINLKPGEKTDNRLCNAAADVVSGAVAGLKRKEIKVVVDGVSRPIGDDSDEAGGFVGNTWMDRVRESEGYYASKIYDQLRYCEGAMVHVNCLPKSESSETKETKYDAKGAITKEIENESESSTTAANRGGSADVGVTSNTGSNKGMAIGDGSGNAGGDGGGETKRDRSRNENFVPKLESIRRDPAGAIAVTSASVAIPRSYFIKAFKSETGADKDPGPAALDAFMKQQIEMLKGQVKNCINVQADEAIVVNAYTDVSPAVDAPTQATSGVSLMIGTHAKEIALGALALISLFMVSMMVRKSGPAVATAAGTVNGLAEGAAGTTVDAVLAKAGIKPGSKMTAEEAAEVGEGGQTLDGVELDDETVKAQQMVEQVSAMVKENPDAAANLIKRWMIRT